MSWPASASLVHRGATRDFKIFELVTAYTLPATVVVVFCLWGGIPRGQYVVVEAHAIDVAACEVQAFSPRAIPVRVVSWAPPSMLGVDAVAIVHVFNLAEVQ